MSPAARSMFKRFVYTYRQRHRFFFVTFKSGFSAVLWCRLHLTSKVSKVPLTKMVTFKARLHVPSKYPCPSKSPSKFVIVSMVTDHLMDRLSSEHILSISVNVTMTVTETVRVNEVYSAIHKAAGRAIPSFAWYNSCGTEKIP